MLTSERAVRRAAAVYPSSPPLRSAYEAGARARRHGVTIKQNPYRRRRVWSEARGRWVFAPGWSHVWAVAWARGWLGSD